MTCRKLFAHCDIVTFNSGAKYRARLTKLIARDFEDDERMTMLMSKILISSESERAIHQDSTYPSDSLVGHPGMLLRHDITVKGFLERM